MHILVVEDEQYVAEVLCKARDAQEAGEEAAVDQAEPGDEAADPDA